MEIPLAKPLRKVATFFIFNPSKPKSQNRYQMGKDLSETIMLNLQGALNANSRKFIESWKSQVSNTQNPGNAKNSAKPKKPKQTQL
jgi:hypothetical protein